MTGADAASEAGADAGAVADVGAALADVPSDECPSEEGVRSVQVTPMTGAIGVGGTLQFQATVTLRCGQSLDVTERATWVSSDPTKATIDARGLATGVAIGTTMITAVFGGVSSSPATLTFE